MKLDSLTFSSLLPPSPIDLGSPGMLVALDQSLILALILVRLGFGKISLDAGERRGIKYIKELLCVKPSTRGLIFIISFYSNSKLMREVRFFTSVLQKKAQRG